MFEVKNADLDFLASFIPGSPRTAQDPSAFLPGCLDRLLAALSAQRVCLLLKRVQAGRLEFGFGREAGVGELQGLWSEMCWVTLGRAMEKDSLCVSDSGSDLALPLTYSGENMGALYVDLGQPLSAEGRALCHVVGAQLALVLAQLRTDRAQRRLREESADNEWLRQRVDDLERSNEDLRHFAHFASHDLHEPVRAVSGYCKILAHHLDKQLDPKVSKVLEQIDGATTRMTSLLRDLLDYAQLGESQWNPQRLNVASILSQARSELTAQIAEVQAVIERAELPWVFGDPTGLRLLFKVLLSNALKFRRGSHPHVFVGHLDSLHGQTFWVRDDGIGIKPEHLNEVFQPFRRLHTLNEFGGNGLGLAMARRIVERHGGHIWIEPNEVFGVTVYFELPTAAAVKEAS